MRDYEYKEEFLWNGSKYIVDVGDCGKCAMYESFECSELRKCDTRFPDCDPETRKDGLDVIFKKVD